MSRNVLHSRAYSRDGLLLLMRQTAQQKGAENEQDTSKN